MGREVRKVPADWEHPRRGLYPGGSINYQPMLDQSYEEALNDSPDHAPDPDYCRPDWTEEERTHFQWYETVSEGSPLSPPCRSLEGLALWLSLNPTPDGSVPPMPYEDWLNVVSAGSVPSMVMMPGEGIVMGTEAMAQMLREEEEK